MSKVIAIDPGIFKCGLIIADIEEKKVYEAIVIQSHLLLKYVKKYLNDNDPKFLIGNGTSSKNYVEDLNHLVPDLIIAEENNSTFRAKQRYFEIFPIRGIKNFLPREIFILNKNLDALAALIIMEDYFNFKFDISEQIKTKTWLK